MSTLRWKSLERSLRQRVAPYDACRRMRFWQRLAHRLSTPFPLPLWIVRAAGTAVLAKVLLTNGDFVREHADYFMMLGGLWCLLIAVGRAGIVHNQDQVVSEHSTLWLLPLSANQIFNRLWQRLSAASLWSMLDSLIFYAPFLLSGPVSGRTWLIAVACAALQALVSFELTLLVLALKIETDKIFVPVLFLAGLLVGAVNRPSIESAAVQAVGFLNPGGWGNLLFLNGALRGSTHAGWASGAIVAFSVSLRYSLEKVRQLNHRGAYRNRQLRPIGRKMGNEEPVPSPTNDRVELRRRVLQSTHLRPPTDHPPGLVDRFVTLGLLPHEKLLAEILSPSGRPWGRSVLKLLMWYAVCLVVAMQVQFQSFDELAVALTQHRDRGLFLAFVFFGCLALVAVMLAKVVGLIAWFAWPERITPASNQMFSPHHTFRLLPINYWDTAKVIAIVDSWFCLLLLPLAILFSFTPAFQLVAHQAARPWVILPKCLALLWGGCLVLLSYKLVPDLRKGWRGWRAWLKAGGTTWILYAVAMGLVAAPNFPADLAVGACWLAVVIGWFSYCGARYRQGLS